MDDPRREPDATADERTMLTQYLDLQRQTLLWKAGGLTKAQLATPHPPSSLTLAGLLKHLTLVERSWFVARFGGRPLGPPWDAVDWDADPDWEFRTAAEDDPADLVAGYEAACEESRQVVAAASSLDDLSATTRRTGERFSLRWVLLHMIEETARHNGHADLIREAVDGQVGE